MSSPARTLQAVKRVRQGGCVGEVLASAVCKLSDEQREAVARYAAKVSWPSGFAIYQRGAPADGVFIVTRGRVVLRSRVRAGRGFIPWIATCGETFGSEGLYPGGLYTTDARSETETETQFLSATKFRAFVREQPPQAIAVFNQLMAERSVLLDKLRELTTLSVEQRIISAIARLSHTDVFTNGQGEVVLTPERYRLLCELVGATRESVSLVINRLTSDGLVERRGTSLVLASIARVMDRAGSEMELPTGTAEPAIQ